MPKEVTYSFLAAGPGFSLELPEEFDSLAGLVTPIMTAAGSWSREFMFVPAAYDHEVTDADRQLDTFEDPSGRRVEFSERSESPRQWYLRWRLNAGSLYAHLREGEDGPHGAQAIVDNLEIEERRNGAPFLFPEGPLSHDASSRPGYQEQAIFRAEHDPDWTVNMRRPSNVPAGKVFESPAGQHTTFRCGTNHDVEIIVHSPEADRGRNVAERALETFGKAG